MRIIAGKYKRTPLLTIDSLSTRPTKDMVKEALFSSIYIDEETFFLDLFSGSGAIGIEALSRGCKKAVFNDLNKEACKIIKQNLNKINESSDIYNLDYVNLLNNLHEQFDYVYIDPPYAFNEYENIFKLLVENHLLKEDARIIVEVKKDVVLNDSIENYFLYKEKKYGITKLLYYRKENHD